MKNLARTIALIERVALGQASTQAELMRDLDIPRSTVSDVLGELTSLGYVAMIGRRYVAGARLLSFVLKASRQVGPPAAIRTALQELVRVVGETAIFVVNVPGEVEGGDVIAVEQVESPHELRYVADIGQPFVATATIAGRAILSFLDAAPDSLADDERVRIRQAGFALSERDHRGAMTVAAPVFDETGEVIGAISVIGPADRMPDLNSITWPALKKIIDSVGSQKTIS